MKRTELGRLLSEGDIGQSSQKKKTAGLERLRELYLRVLNVSTGVHPLHAVLPIVLAAVLAAVLPPALMSVL